jgi:predicted O-methyltransferase YrrM
MTNIMRQSDNSASVRLFFNSVLERMRPIEGWLADAEASLLITAVAQAVKALPEIRAMVEIGSYCGKSTVVIGSVLSEARTNGIKLFAIDPHEGVVGAIDNGLYQTPQTLEKFRHNISHFGLSHLVEIVRKLSFEVDWNQPISFLFIDGLHDYENVARDFNHFKSWLAPGGFVAFHDYADHFPGVKTFVDELVEEGCYEKVRCVLSMIVLRKKTNLAVFLDEQSKK